MTRALLIKPTNSHFDTAHLKVNFEPLGLMCISSFARKYSAHEVAILDAQAESPAVCALGDGRFRMGLNEQEIADAVRLRGPAVVGISCLFERIEDDVLMIANAVKSVSQDIFVVLGGMDAAVRYEKYLERRTVDVVVIGEGEETFVEILDAVEGGRRPEGIEGTCDRRADGSIRRNPPRSSKRTFDEYPFPDRDALPRHYYENRKNQAISYPFSQRYPALLLQSSRGCTMRCAFCQIVSVCREWRAHGAGYVVDEMQACIDKYGAREFVFLDDNFMLHPARVGAICDLIIERRLDVSIDILAGIAVWTLSEALIDRMIKAGLYRVILPIESGNPDTLRFIGKPVNLEKGKTMIEFCNRRGLLTIGNLIIGFPNENEDDIARTIAWGRSSGLDAIYFLVAHPMQGARMYSVYEDNGWLTAGHEGKEAYHRWWHQGSWRTAYFSAEELGEIAQYASMRYILHRMLSLIHPAGLVKYLLPKISGRGRLRYVVRVAVYILFSGERVSSGQRFVEMFKVFRRPKRYPTISA